MHKFDDLDSAFSWALSSVLQQGAPVAPRQLGTMELSGVSFTLTNPRARLIGNVEREWSLPYAFGDVLWHFAASNELEFISYYSRNWSKYVDHQKYVYGSCYGHKIFTRSSHSSSQWELAKMLLQFDPATRRCVIATNDPTDLANGLTKKDLPCCQSLQFLIRDGRLCLIVNMRSNDLMYGFTYDIHLFTMLQERMAFELGVPLGWYQHVVGSLHLYERDIPWAERIIASPNRVLEPMPVMDSVEQLPTVLGIERSIRESADFRTDDASRLSRYWRDIVAVLQHYKLHKSRKTIPSGATISSQSNPTYSRLLEAMEDRVDLGLARKALKEKGRVPWERAKKELGL